MQIDFFRTLLVLHMKEKVCPGSCMYAHLLSSLQTLRSYLLLVTGCFLLHVSLRTAEKAHAPISHHAAFPPIVLILYWLPQKLGNVFTSFSCVLFVWRGQAANCPWALDQKCPSRLCWGVSMCSSHTGLHMYWACEWQANNMALGKILLQSWQLALWLKPTQTHLSIT